MKSEIVILLFFILKSAWLMAECGPQDLDIEADLVTSSSPNSNKDAALEYSKCTIKPTENSPDPSTHRIIRLPDQNHVRPTKIIRSYEKQHETVYTDHYLQRNIWQPGDGYPPVFYDKYYVKTRKISRENPGE